MPTKEEFTHRIAAGLAKRKRERAAERDAEFDEKTDFRVIAGYMREKGNGHGKKCLNPSFFQC